MGKSAPARYGDPLTDREREVLRLVSSGLTNKEIGGRLFLSEDTIKTHVHRLMVKMGVASRLDAVMLGIRKSLVSCPCGRVVTS